MMPAPSNVEAGIWSVPGHAPVVEYARAALNDILVEVVDAFDAYYEGGFEVGGILLGTQDGTRVRILGHAPLPIRPPRPSFVLSEIDQHRLSELIKSHSRQMQVVGFYVSHTRSEVFLTESDQELFDRYFPELWQVAMVLHPADNQPVRIGFFFREEDGYIRSDQSYMEMAVDAPERDRRLRKPPPWQFDARGEPIAPPEPAPVEIEVPEEAETYSLPPEPAPRGRWAQAATWIGGLIVVAIVAAGIYAFRMLQEPDPPMGLRMLTREGEVVIVWDPASPTIQEATDLALRITDGAHQQQLPLPRNATLPEVSYRPKTGRVDATLVATSRYGRHSQEIATFLAHPDMGKPTPELLEARRELEEAMAEYETLKKDAEARSEAARQLQSSTEQLQLRLEDLVAAKQRRLEAKRTALLTPKKAAPLPSRDLPSAPEISARTPTTSPTVPSAALPPRPAEPEPVRPTAPVSAPTPAQTPAQPSTAVASLPRTTPPPIAVAIPKPASSGYAGPMSGRLIWTGELPRDGVLSIEGRKASRGNISGELPGIPVRIGAYPAEFVSGSNIRVLTGNPKYGTPKEEQEGPSTGWNKMRYVYEPKAYRDLIVEQMPSGQELKKLTLRAGGRKLSVIVIEWQAAVQ